MAAAEPRRVTGHPQAHFSSWFADREGLSPAEEGETPGIPVLPRIAVQPNK